MPQGLFSSLYTRGAPFALIDPQERRDHVNGHWFGSTNVPLSVLSERLPRMVPDRAFPIHLLDWQDTPSRVAYDLIRDLGYASVTRHPTERPAEFGQGFVQGEYTWSKAFGEVVAHTSGLPEVTPEDYLAHHRDAVLFDTRPTAEYRQFTIPGSQSLPNSLVLGNLEALKASGQTALLHCAGRTRSIIGACTLKAAGYDGPFAIFKGGTQAWQLDGHPREHGADRVFATDTGEGKGVAKILARWGIPRDEVAAHELGDYVARHNGAHLFDVSQDAATGEPAEHGIWRISGTNLIQQTDRSLARYHVPVVLFDVGSGSRAAFAAYWLRAMGFAPRIAHLDQPPASAPVPDHPAVSKPVPILTLADLSPDMVVRDVRPSADYARGHLAQSQWTNLSLCLREGPVPGPMVIVGRSDTHAAEVAAILTRHGCQVAGTLRLDSVPADDLMQGPAPDPVDQSTLFAGRHHGNMQDSRDYLAWEEDLPDQIDRAVHDLWHSNLTG